MRQYDYDDLKISRLIKNNQYKEAVALIRKEIRRYPTSHWLHACLSTSLYEQRKYKEAVKAARQAVALRKKDGGGRCPLSMWYLATALDMDKQPDEALAVFHELLKWGMKAAHGICGEGEQWTKAVLNDCRYRIALIYWQDKKDHKTARKWAKLHLRQRAPGVKSIYPKANILRDLKTIEQEIKNGQKS